MSDGTYRHLTSLILTAHQRRGDGNCLCGRLRLGDSWSDHVADLLDHVGALRDRPPQPGGERDG